MSEINWEQVAAWLDNESRSLRDRAPSAFPNDFAAQREMLTRAAIFGTFADALRAGARDDRAHID